jgi:hypothetical protein
MRNSPKIRLIPNMEDGMGGTSEIRFVRYFFGKLDGVRPLGRPRHK